MFFWQRREVWLGDFDGCRRARRALEQAGIFCETRVVRRDRTPVPAQSGSGLGNTLRHPEMHCLYVRRADMERARALLGTEEIR